MSIWRHIDWEIFEGTWLIVSATLTDEEVQKLLLDKFPKYGMPGAWVKIK